MCWRIYPSGHGLCLSLEKDSICDFHCKLTVAMMNSVFRLAHVSEEESSEFQEDEDESHDGDIAAKEATKSQDVEASHSAERLDPQTQLRQTLINEGFAERDIDGALGKMWDRQLPYDDCNAVRDFLREENVDGFVKGQCPPEEETKTTSTADSTSGTTTNPSDRDDENRPPSTESEANAERQSLGSAKDNRTKDDSQQKPKKSIGHSLDIASKLELVADYENLTDAAFALSEWVAKAADAAEVRAPFFFTLVYMSSCPYTTYCHSLESTGPNMCFVRLAAHIFGTRLRSSARHRRLELSSP